MSCDNPCNTQAAANTALCESLPSQIDNFTLNFFGEVFKTEVNGQVSWSLPGRLDVGLSQNPRGPTEPLGCYLLRLFQAGVIGARGDQGFTGLNGVNGNNPYVQVMLGFPQPQVGVPFQVKTTESPAIMAGMDVIIQGSGWYEVVTSDKHGNLVLVLRVPVVVPKSYIAAGTYLLPSGKVGAAGNTGLHGVPGMQGPVGAKGVTGNTGAQGISAPQTSFTIPYYAPPLPTFTINWPFGVQQVDGYMGGLNTTSFSPVVLFPGSVPCQVKLPTPGTYLIMARSGTGATPITVDPNTTPPLVGAQGNSGINILKLRNISTATDLPQGSGKIYQNGRLTAYVQTLTPNNIIQVFAKAVVGAGVISIHYIRAFKLS